MAEAWGKQEAIREFKPLSRLVGGTWNHLAKVAEKHLFLVSFSTYPEHAVHGNPFPPFSLMLLNGPYTQLLTNSQEINFSNLIRRRNIFNEEPVCPETIFYI